MSETKLDKCIENLKKCYVGKQDGKHTLDKSKIDGLTFMVSTHEVSKAVECGTITAKEFTKRITSKAKKGKKK